MLKTRIPPPVYALLSAWTMWRLHLSFPVMQLWGAEWGRIGWVIGLAGLLLDGWSVVLFLQSRTTVNPMRPDRARHLVISGFYRFSRNPMYLGLLLQLSGWAVWLGSVSPFAILPLFVGVLTEMQIKPEENMLTISFGEEYKEYRRHVHRWFGRKV
jgi:protein-S-isoprenylcysteine O-methyltransferase Ste14